MGADVIVLGDDQSYAAGMANDYILKPSSERAIVKVRERIFKKLLPKYFRRKTGLARSFRSTGPAGLGSDDVY